MLLSLLLGSLVLKHMPEVSLQHIFIFQSSATFVAWKSHNHLIVRDHTTLYKRKNLSVKTKEDEHINKLIYGTLGTGVIFTQSHRHQFYKLEKNEQINMHLVVNFLDFFSVLFTCEFLKSEVFPFCVSFHPQLFIW